MPVWHAVVSQYAGYLPREPIVSAISCHGAAVKAGSTTERETSDDVHFSLKLVIWYDGMSASVSCLVRV